MAKSTIRDLIVYAVKKLTDAGIATARLDAEILLCEVTGCQRAELISSSMNQLSNDQIERFRLSLNRRVEREPIAYILGKKHFRRLELSVDKRVLIPRPETEHLVEAALALPEGVTVVDVGTGSGAVALALKDERPDLRVIAIDSSNDALSVAKENGKTLGIDVDFRFGEYLQPVLGEKVDAVVSNPPYVRTDEAGLLAPEIKREPTSALFAGHDGLDFYRVFVPQVAEMKSITFLAVEIGESQAEDIAGIFEKHDFLPSVFKDLAGKDRVISAYRLGFIQR